MARETRQQQIEEKRPRRSLNDIGANILTVDNQEPGYHYYWASDSQDIPGGIKRFLDAGYTFVTDPTKVGDPTVNQSSGIGSAVSINGGRGTRLYLMRIPLEWYNEDQQKMEDQIKELEMTMRQPKEGEYGKVKMERK
jgi:hypothetical protein